MPANPYFIKQLPGRRSDVKDAHRIAQCLQKELIRGSFVPDDVLQQMRQLSRQCRRLTKNRARLEQQMDNQLQRCNIRFSNDVSNQGNNVSLRKSIKAIIGGERDPTALNRPVHGRTGNRHGVQSVTASLDGVINGTDAEMLTQCMEQIDLLEKQQARCLTRLGELAGKYYAGVIALPCTIPDIQKFSALCILSEIGNDMDAFGKAFHLAGRAGLRPRNDESPGRIQSRKILHGNKCLRQILVEIAWVASRSGRTFLGKKHRELSWRMKSQKALLAITRKIPVIIFNVLKTGQAFDPRKKIQRQLCLIEKPSPARFLPAMPQFHAFVVNCL
jgi:transposase